MPPERAGAPLVSCIVTAWNCGPFLAAALESALAQDVPGGLEIVVVDDGSTDDTPRVLAAFADRVRVVRQPNAGVCGATNRGVEEARGAYLTFLDGDDVLLPGKIQAQVDVLESRPEVGLVYCDLEIVDADERPLAPSFLAAHGLTPRSGQVMGALLYNNVVPTCLMVRASLRDAWHPIDVDALAQDWWIAAGVAGVAELHYQPEPRYRYRTHGGNRFLDATPERQRLLVRREVPFRRRLLTTAPLERASAAEVLAGSAAFERSVAIAVQVLGVAAEQLVPVDGPRAEAARRAQAAAVGAADD